MHVRVVEAVEYFNANKVAEAKRKVEEFEEVRKKTLCRPGRDVRFLTKRRLGHGLIIFTAWRPAENLAAPHRNHRSTNHAYRRLRPACMA